MPRGGRRPGAGAPKGNMNALKHGRRSRQLAELGAALAASPAAREALLAIAEKHQRRERKADRVAAYILGEVLVRGLKRGADRLSVMPPVDDRRSIVAAEGAPKPAPAAKNAKKRARNQPQTRAPEHNQPPDTEEEVD